MIVGEALKGMEFLWRNGGHINDIMRQLRTLSAVRKQNY